MNAGAFDLTSATSGPSVAGVTLTVNGAPLLVGNANAIGPATIPLNLVSGKLSSDSANPLSIANPLTISGSGNISLGDSIHSGAITFSNASQTITDSPIIAFAGSNLTFGTGPLSLLGSPTFFDFNLNKPTLTLKGGINTNGLSNTITLNTSNNAVVISGGLTGNGGTLILGGTGSNISATFSGGNSVNFEVNGPTVVDMNQLSAGYTGFTSLAAGLLELDNSGSLSGSSGLFLGGGAIESDSGGAKTVSIPLTITGSTTFTGTAGGSLAFTNALQQVTGNGVNLTFTNSATTFQTNPFVVTGAGFSITTASAGAVTFSNSFNIGTNDIAITASGGLVNFTGGITYSGSRTLSLSGAGGISFAGAFSGSNTPSLTFVSTNLANMTLGAVTNPGPLVFNGPTVSANNGTNAFTTGATLLSGILEIAADSTGLPVTSGPLGTGLVTLSGGTIRASTGNPHTLGNAILVNNNLSFAPSISNSHALTFTGGLTVMPTALGAAPTLTFNDPNTTTFSGAITLNSDIGIAGTGAASIRSGLILAPQFPATNITITDNNTNATGVSIHGALNGGTNTLTIGGTGTVLFGDGTAVTGSSAGVIVNGATVNFGNSSNSFIGGVSMLSGTTVVAAGGNPGNTTRANSTAYTLNTVIVPATPNGFFYQVTTAGTTAATPPTSFSTVPSARPSRTARSSTRCGQRRSSLSAWAHSRSPAARSSRPASSSSRIRST